MVYTYKPRGVCSQSITLEIDENHILKNAEFVGGCNGNTKGICSLVRGMKAEDVVARLKGIDCRGRGTSCPDQLAKAVEEAMNKLA